MTHTVRFSKLVFTALACLILTGTADSTSTVDQPPLTVVNPEVDAGTVEKTEWVEDAFPAQLGSTPTTRFTDAQQSLVDFAFGRFRAAGLNRPHVAIEFPDDRTECFGYGGVYLPRTKTVRVCWMLDTTIVHELVHAWLDENLDDAERVDFLTLRRLDSWVDAGEWDERGAEHAAEIITWGILDRNISIRWIESDDDGTMTTTWRLAKLPDDSDPDRLFEAFELLTGTDATPRRADDPRTTPTTTILSPEAKR